MARRSDFPPLRTNMKIDTSGHSACSRFIARVSVANDGKLRRDICPQMAKQTTSGSLPAGKVVVLGGTGLIGRHVIEALAAAGIEVAATYRARRPFEGHGVQWRQADLTKPAEARAVLVGAKVSIMCAGKVSTTAELRRDPTGS